MLGLAVGLERQQIGLQAELAGELHQVAHHGSIVITGEGILHDEHHFLTLLGAHGLQPRQVKIAGAMVTQLLGQGRHAQ